MFRGDESDVLALAVLVSIAKAMRYSGESKIEMTVIPGLVSVFSDKIAGIASGDTLMRYATLLLFAGLFTATAFAQRVSLGVKGGVRLNDDLESGGEGAKVSESKRYTLGPTVELKLPHRLSLEIDALYKRLGTSSYSKDITGWGISRDRSNSWEFPILAKYRLVRKLPAPYVSGGYAFRHITGSGTLTDFCCVNTFGGPSNPTLTNSTYSTNYKNSSGLVVGGGMELETWYLRFSPEFRYTRWNNWSLYDYGSYGYYAKSAQNQAEILVGIAWRRKLTNAKSP